MSKLYNYCTRCGDELTDDQSDRIADADNAPALCQDCIRSLFSGFADLFASALEPVNDALESFAKALQSNKDNE